MPRALLTRSAAVAIAASALVVSGLNLSGAAASVAAPRQANGAPVWMAITSVSPDFARPGTTVTVTGTLTHISRHKISGLAIQLRSSGTAFNSRGQLQAYANGTDPFADRTIVGAVTNLPGTLAPQATVGWSVALPGSQLPMSAFGVYPLAPRARAGCSAPRPATRRPMSPSGVSPLAAEADSSAQTQLAVSRTFLPF